MANGHNDIQQVELALATSNDMQKYGVFRLCFAVLHTTQVNDATIKPYLGRLPEELDAIEKAILRIATLELTERIDVPYRVIINEAIELAKAFGAEESHKFINGALDKAVRTLRKDERD